MAANVTRDEFQHLENRVSVVEQEVEGEKLVTRHILEQTRRNGDDLAAIKSRLGGVEQKLDGVDLKGLVRKVDGLDRKVDDLTTNMPRIVGDVMREVLRERKE
jgi:tetrahydromethanopterin S-methyltransferase subunit G